MWQVLGQLSRYEIGEMDCSYPQKTTEKNKILKCYCKQERLHSGDDKIYTLKISGCLR